MLANFQDQFLSLTFGGLSLGFIYVLIALGYTMVYGVLRMINFANSEVFMYGTFATVVIIRDFFGFTQQSEPATGFRLFYILLLCLAGSMLVSGILSIFLELVAYRRLRNRGSNKLAPLISAIGMSIVLAEFMRILTDSRYVGSPRVMEKSSLATIFGANLRLDNVIVIVCGLVLYLVLQQFVKKTRLGKAIRAVSMNEDSAKLMGVNLNFVVSGTFLLHLGGKLEVNSKVPLKTRDDLSRAYTPGVARICLAIAKDPSDARRLTIKRNTVAVVTDGSAVLGLGNLGPAAALPVMEGKAALFKIA